MIAPRQLQDADAAELLDRPEPRPPAARRAVSFGGWLFDAQEFAPAPELGPADLDDVVANLTATASTCAAVGIAYLPMMIPAKRNLINEAPSSDRGWVSELNARLRDVDDVELMSLFGVLRHAKRHGRPYHRADADWNDLGAFFVARALLKEAHKTLPALQPLALADMHLRPVEGYRGTLIDAPRARSSEAELVGREADVDAEDGVVIDTSRLRARRMPVEADIAEGGPAHVHVYANAACEEGAAVAVVGDAAALPVVRWLSEATPRTTLFWSSALPVAQLELERPALAVHLIRETDLLRPGRPPGDA